MRCPSPCAAQREGAKPIASSAITTKPMKGPVSRFFAPIFVFTSATIMPADGAHLAGRSIPNAISSPVCCAPWFLSGGGKEKIRPHPASRSRCSNRSISSWRVAGTAMVLRVRLAGVVSAAFSHSWPIRSTAWPRLREENSAVGMVITASASDNSSLVSPPARPEQKGAGERRYFPPPAAAFAAASGVRISRTTSRARAVVASTNLMSASAAAISG